uniref:NADH dehydrogenase subunit 5 n=1 Tax=Chrysopetalum debile TaxID=115833 RepID=UPI001EDE041F|nr:NADH dehydrogenase subunit 5 [Chrysopetalum debile]UJV31485.1 NADH dehydrogenase subunit 5 [Chrysopetalum debile]
MNHFNSALLFNKILVLIMLILTPLSLFINGLNQSIIIEWTIIPLGTSDITLPIIIDSISCMFSLTVMFISANVLYFAKSYMEEEVFLNRFIIMVMLFVLSMNLLIFIPHMISLLIGWDGLGITSFVLVIYYQSAKSLGAGMITALTNRIGDVLILISVALTLNMGHWNIFNLWPQSYLSSLTIILLMVAAMTKSAQVPFSSWLPAAMAAPTPVSALVHSSTLVTAGIFILIRFYPFLSSFYLFNFLLLIFSTLTMTMAGMTALVETDMKKIIALSTLSQLGVMMSSIALGLPMLAFFHLITHALFKALLFICAGTMIHIHNHSQDMRHMGNIIIQMPLTSSTLLIANLALCGLPFMAGFYSKDLIIEMTLFNPTNLIISSLYLFATSLTAAYSIRFMISVLWGSNLGSSLQYTSDEDFFTTYPMLFLSLGAIIGGSLMNWVVLNPIAHPILPFMYKLSPLVVTLGGAWIALVLVAMSPVSKPKAFTLSTHFNTFMWFLVPISTQGPLTFSMPLSHHMLKSIDQSWIEASSAQGIKLKAFDSSYKALLFNNNMITTHIVLIITAMIILFS